METCLLRILFSLSWQGVSVVKAFYELLSQSSLGVLHPGENKPVAPVEHCPILKMLYKILIKREFPLQAILEALRDETMYDPKDRIEIAQTRVLQNITIWSATLIQDDPVSLSNYGRM
ncbi:hypothetical protein PTKIN_Ptkin17bG0170300 [Pterospermum kingtungense]